MVFGGSCLVFVCFFLWGIFQDRVSLYSTGYLGTCSVDETGLEFSVGIKGMHHHILFHLVKVLFIPKICVLRLSLKTNLAFNVKLHFHVQFQSLQVQISVFSLIYSVYLSFLTLCDRHHFLFSSNL